MKSFLEIKTRLAIQMLLLAIISASATAGPSGQDRLSDADQFKEENPNKLVDVKDFDISGIKLQMTFKEVFSIFKNLQKKEGGSIIDDSDGSFDIVPIGSEPVPHRHLSYLSNQYRIGIHISEPYQYNGKQFDKRIYEIKYTIQNYKIGSGGKEIVIKKYGPPTLDHSKTDITNTEYIEYCQNIKIDRLFSYSLICNSDKGAYLDFSDGVLILRDAVFEKFTKEHSIPPPPLDIKF